MPNIMELSRNMAGHVPLQRPAAAATGTLRTRARPATTWVNPFNPCLPDRVLADVSAPSR